MNIVVSYFRDSLEELRHVQWPTQQQAIRLTTIVVAFIAINAAVFGLVDFLLGALIRSTL